VDAASWTAAYQPIAKKTAAAIRAVDAPQIAIRMFWPSSRITKHLFLEPDVVLGLVELTALANDVDEPSVFIRHCEFILDQVVVDHLGFEPLPFSRCDPEPKYAGPYDLKFRFVEFRSH
jgi:hypothetical protein